MRVELIGLPGVGKSYYLNEHLAPSHPDPRPVTVGGSTATKVRNIARGAFGFPRLAALFVTHSFSGKTRLGAKRFLVLLERVGRLSCQASSAVDEGPLQAVWALFYQRDLTDENKRACARLIREINVAERVIYVYASGALHAAFVAKRQRKHGLASADVEAQRRARRWMRFVLCEVRRSTPRSLEGHRVQMAS
ncbi:hypothetical protein L0664_07675 [Octadecabacter sp. G9-8]|uniref:G domain-containing protein n=1 Tax=Octadecabacter dasysiphoniae TaxID=2909341 RepID=A0ABS9CUM1_9RHOB|nr:hypothetical protein [Octadecabacter dasysiphoniae]MCF2870940.1 hypothetical protein [Octadecabacter dasysiphoniae]